MGKVILKPTSSWSESNKECEAVVDGELVPVRRNEKKEVASRDGKVSYRIHRSADDVIVLETPFTCLPSNRERVIRLYAEKVKRGEILPELRNMEKSFSTEMEVPVSCSSPAL